MAEKIATRKAYGEALVEYAEEYPELVVLEADLAEATMTKFFRDKFPQRFFEMGIAECNMQGVAAGMASCGLKPFTNTFAMFVAGRSWGTGTQYHRVSRYERKGYRFSRRFVSRRGRGYSSVH